MGKITRIGLVLGVVVILASFLAVLAFRTGYSVQEMDWNSDGTTSIGELLRAIDVGRRSIVKDGNECQEYYNLKDGVPVRIVCPAVR